MSDTTLRECVICEQEGDCIEGVCSNCAAEDDLQHYLSATSRLSKKVKQLQADNERMLRMLKEFRELLFRIAGGPLELGAAYGPDFEPPTDEDVREMYIRLCKEIEVLTKP